jgi:hypothetical protein
MSKSIDLKSALTGGLLALLVVTCLGGLPWVSQELFGRFQIVTIDRGAFILDTATGQGWAHVTPDEVMSITPGFDEPKIDPNGVIAGF